jgi:hypothetical protein
LKRALVVIGENPGFGVAHGYDAHRAGASDYGDSKKGAERRQTAFLGPGQLPHKHGPPLPGRPGGEPLTQVELHALDEVLRVSYGRFKLQLASVVSQDEDRAVLERHQLAKLIEALLEGAHLTRARRDDSRDRLQRLHLPVKLVALAERVA